MPVPQSGNQSSLCEKLGLATALPSFLIKNLMGGAAFYGIPAAVFAGWRLATIW